MRIPFISRVAYDDLRDLLKEERQRTKELTDLVADMKVAGGMVVRGSTKQEAEKRLPEMIEIEDVIDRTPFVQGDPALRRHLVSVAEAQLDAGMSPKEVLAEMSGWYNGSDETATSGDDE